MKPKIEVEANTPYDDESTSSSSTLWVARAQERAKKKKKKKASRLVRSWDLRASHPSSSSLLVGAGSGADEASCEESCTLRFANGFNDCSVDIKGVEDASDPAGASVALRDQPRELLDSRNEADAMIAQWSVAGNLQKKTEVNVVLYASQDVVLCS